MKMQYIGNSCLTIRHGEIAELIAIKRTPDTYKNHITSPIMLAFRKEEGSTLAWCDRTHWIKVKPINIKEL